MTTRTSKRRQAAREGRGAGLRRVSAPSLVEQIYSDLHVRLSSGTMGEGEKIVIDALALDYGVSATPIREALNRLASERFLVLEPHRGYRVAAKVGSPEMRHLFQVRIVLESGAIRHGFANATPAVVDRLRDTNRRLAALLPADEPAEHLAFIRVDEEFHQVLIALPGNPFLIDAYEQLGYHRRLPQATFTRGLYGGDNIIAEHEAVIDALERQDCDAAIAAIVDHISSGAARFDLMN